MIDAYLRDDPDAYDVDFRRVLTWPEGDRFAAMHRVAVGTARIDSERRAGRIAHPWSQPPESRP